LHAVAGKRALRFRPDEPCAFHVPTREVCRIPDSPTKAVNGAPHFHVGSTLRKLRRFCWNGSKAFCPS
jgi:hypothetical protein